MRGGWAASVSLVVLVLAMPWSATAYPTDGDDPDDVILPRPWCVGILHNYEGPLDEVAGLEYEGGQAVVTHFTPLEPVSWENPAGEWSGRLTFAGVCLLVMQIEDCLESGGDLETCLRAAHG